MTSEISDKLVIEYFNSLRNEIHLRLQEHHKLWIYKLIFCGTLLSFSFSTEGIAQFGCILAPLLAIVLDFLILNNQIIINSIGTYIYKEIETLYLPSGWETKSRDLYISGPKYSWISDWVLVFLSSFIIFFISIYSSYKLNLLIKNSSVVFIYIFSIISFLLVIIFPFKHMSKWN